MLYRGVSKSDDEANGGMLLPKGTVPKVVLRFDGSWRFDGTYLYGPSEHNTARAHQIDSGQYGGSGVSTSRSEREAIKFATYGNLVEGFVYVIDETKLEEANVSALEFPDSLHAHEQEVTLIERTGASIPASVIVEKYAVDDCGFRI